MAFSSTDRMGTGVWLGGREGVVSLGGGEGREAGTTVSNTYIYLTMNEKKRSCFNTLISKVLILGIFQKFTIGLNAEEVTQDGLGDVKYATSKAGVRTVPLFHCWRQRRRGGVGEECGGAAEGGIESGDISLIQPSVAMPQEDHHLHHPPTSSPPQGHTRHATRTHPLSSVHTPRHSTPTPPRHDHPQHAFTSRHHKRSH